MSTELCPPAALCTIHIGRIEVLVIRQLFKGLVNGDSARKSPLSFGRKWSQAFCTKTEGELEALH